MTPPRLTPAAMVAELTRPHHHRETITRTATGPVSYRVTEGHTTRVPSLLDQLQHAAPSGDGAGRSGAYESRPAARLEALDVLITIDHQSARWVRLLGLDDPGHTDRCVTLAGSLLPRARHCGQPRPTDDCCPAHTLEHDIRSWWVQARIVTGWDDPAWRPDNTCPACAKLGGLRVRLEERVAMCAECRTSWDPTSYQQFADHIREENAARGARTAEPCWCPWPTPVDRIDQLCPRCTSARCHRAVLANFTRAERLRTEREARWAARRRRLASETRRTTRAS